MFNATQFFVDDANHHPFSTYRLPQLSRKLEPGSGKVFEVSEVALRFMYHEVSDTEAKARQA